MCDPSWCVEMYESPSEVYPGLAWLALGRRESRREGGRQAGTNLVNIYEVLTVLINVG